MTHDFVKPKKIGGLDTNTHAGQRSPFASRPFLATPRSQPQPQDIQTMRERGARYRAANPHIYGTPAQPQTVQRQASETEEESLQMKANESVQQKQEQPDLQTLIRQRAARVDTPLQRMMKVQMAEAQGLEQEKDDLQMRQESSVQREAMPEEQDEKKPEDIQAKTEPQPEDLEKEEDIPPVQAKAESQPEDLENKKPEDIQPKLNSTVQAQEDLDEEKPEDLQAKTESQPEDLENKKPEDIQPKLNSTVQAQEDLDKEKPEDLQAKTESQPEDLEEDSPPVQTKAEPTETVEEETKLQEQQDLNVQSQPSQQEEEVELQQKVNQAIQQQKLDEQKKDAQLQTRIDRSIQRQKLNKDRDQGHLQQQINHAVQHQELEKQQEETQLQRRINRAVQKQKAREDDDLLKAPPAKTQSIRPKSFQTKLQNKLQTKLTVGKPGDKYEQEADKVAAKVMAMPETEQKISQETELAPKQEEPGVQMRSLANSITSVGQGQLTGDPQSVVQNKEGQSSTQPGLESRLASQQGQGSPLPDETRNFMESRFGADFGNVRVHTGSQAVQMNQELGAQAFTHGNDVYFNSGKFNPGSSSGKELLAHELTHVVQQVGAISPKTTSELPTKVQLDEIRNGKSSENQHLLEVLPASAIIQKREVCDSSGVCWSEAGPEESAYADEPNASYSEDVGTLTESTTKQEEDPKKPVFEEYKGQSINKVGYVSSRAEEYKIAKTVGVNVRAKPDGTLPHIAKVLYGNKVQVQALDNTGSFYFIIADTGAVGWINKNFVALDPPDPRARLHHITESNLTTILKNEYVDKSLWTLSTGNDYTTLAAAVVVANEARKGVSVDWEKAQKYKEEEAPLYKRWFDPWMIDNFAIYQGSKILKGHNIWLPSPDYVRILQSSGVIGSRPGWINTAVDIGKGIAGFTAGIISGIFGSLWDTLTGLWELGKGIVSTIKGALDGSLFASIKSIYDTVTNMTWEDFKHMVDEVITMGKNAFSDFQNQWEGKNAPGNEYKKWHFRGYTIGAIVLEVVLAIFTGGATLGAKVLAKIGKYFPKLMGVLNKLLKVADDLNFRRRGKGRGDKSKDRDDDRDHDKDNENMSKADREWEQARKLAALIAEAHDEKDTPVDQLIAQLNNTIAIKSKIVHKYRAIPKVEPNTYKIIQLSRKNIVDKDYTDEGKRHFQDDPKSWPVKKFDSIEDLPKFKGKDRRGDFEIFDTLPSGIVYNIKGTRVWRDSSGKIHHETTLGSSLGKRAGTEKEMFAQGEHGNLPDIPDGWERAHSLGQGTGFESPFGILYAPKYVNQALQNRGIEKYMRALTTRKLSNGSYKLSTTTSSHSGSLRLKEIRYQAEIEIDGKRYPFFEYSIQVQGTKNKPLVKANPIKFADNAFAQSHKNVADVPDILNKSINKDVVASE